MYYIPFFIFEDVISFDVLFNTFLWAKNGKSICSFCNFLGYSTSTSSNAPYSPSLSEFFIKSLVYRLGLSQIKFLKGNFLHSAHPYKLFTSWYYRYDDITFLL